MRIFLAVVLLSLLFTGSVYQTYEQTVDIGGKSVITREEDAGLFLGLLGDDAAAKIGQACAKDGSLGCSYSEGKLKLTERFSPSDGYYDFEASYGLPYVEYELNVRKIPADRFMERLNDILVAAGLTNITEQSGRPIDLASDNAEMARLLGDSGLEISYVIVMPGEIAIASAGGVEAEKEYDAAAFALSEVLEQRGPITVRSRELNLGYILLILAVLIIVAFTASFFFGKKKR